MTTNNIDPLKLPYVFLSEKSKLPETSGVYFAIAPSNRIIYVGSSSNLQKRWRNHNLIKDFDDYRYIKIAWLELEQGWLHLESCLINKLKPVLNIRGRHFILDEDYRSTHPRLDREFMSKLINGIVECDPVSMVLGMDYGLI